MAEALGEDVDPVVLSEGADEDELAHGEGEEGDGKA